MKPTRKPKPAKLTKTRKMWAVFFGEGNPKTVYPKKEMAEFIAKSTGINNPPVRITVTWKE